MSHVFIDTHGRIRARAFRLSLLAAPWIALSLGGCAVDRTVTGTVPGPNYKETHPIEMVESPTTLDVYPAATHMDRETHLRLKEFATGFHANGIGQIEILMPQGAPNSAHLQNALPAIRKSLAAGGATGYVSVGTYPPKSEERYRHRQFGAWMAQYAILELRLFLSEHLRDAGRRPTRSRQSAGGSAGRSRDAPSQDRKSS
jgi:hypothetical protein